MLLDYFTELTDPRQPWKVKHDLLEIVVMTICAVIAGCDAWEDIVDFCRVKETWFKRSLHLKLEKGSVERAHGLWGSARKHTGRRPHNGGNTLLHHVSG